MAPWARCLAHPRTGPLLVVGVCFVAFFVGLGGHHLLDPDEGRSAEVAREMLVSGNWLVPTLNFDRFHDKPAFYYWLIASSLRLFGTHDWAVRLPGVLAACASVLCTGVWAGRYLGRLTGCLSAVVLATTLGFIAMGRVALTDATFSWWMIAALFYGSAWWMEGARRGWPPWPFYVLVALATLTKGPAGPMLAVLVFVPFAWRTGLPVSIQRIQPVRGAVLLLIIAGTWYGAASVAAPEYVWNFLWNHNLRRYTEGSGGHAANAVTFIYLLPAAFLPWSLYFPTTAAALRRQARQAPVSDPLRFCIVWIAAVIGFFSLSGSKLITYVLPAFPPLAILVASSLSTVVARDGDDRIPVRVHQWVLGTLVAVSVVGALVLLCFFHEFAPTKVALAALPLAALVPLSLAARSVAAGRHSSAVAAVAAFTLIDAGLYYRAAAPTFDAIYSLREPSRLVLASPDDPTVLTYRMSAYSLQYYAGRRTHAVATAEEAAALLSGTAPVVLITRGRHLDAIRSLMTPTVNVWWQGPRSRILISNRPPPLSAS